MNQRERLKFLPRQGRKIRLTVTARESADEELWRAQEAVREQALDGFLQRLRQTRAVRAATRKSVPWKLALAGAMKTRTTATNRWMAEKLHRGNMHELTARSSPGCALPIRRWPASLV